MGIALDVSGSGLKSARFADLRFVGGAFVIFTGGLFVVLLEPGGGGFVILTGGGFAFLTGAVHANEVVDVGCGGFDGLASSGVLSAFL